MIDDDVPAPGEVLDDGSAHATGVQPVSQRRSMMNTAHGSMTDMIGTWARRSVDDLLPTLSTTRRNLAAARTFFTMVLSSHGRPEEVATDLVAPLLRVIDELLADVLHDTEQYANNRIENDHGRLKARLRPMRGLRTDQTASVVTRGHAFIQNPRRGHYELGVEARHEQLRLAAAFDELADAI